MYLYLSVELEIENSEEHEGDEGHACVELSALEHLEQLLWDGMGYTVVTQ